MKESALTKTTWVYIDKNTTKDSIYKQLGKGAENFDNLTNLKLAEKVLALRSHSNIEQMYGAYRLDSGMCAAKIMNRILRHEQTPVKVTFHDVRLLTDLAGRFSSKLMADSTEFLNAMLAPEFLSEAQTDSANVIGIFLPDTYEFYWTIEPDKFVRKMLAEYYKFWTEERTEKAKALCLTKKEIEIICSIAEEETQNRAERGIVARLYLNRFLIGMPLQADPTVKFAVGDFSIRRITGTHLSFQSPYNTYLNNGLTPGPIRIVEKATIDSFLNSKPHNYIYMCAKEDFSGTHNFATNFADHQRNAAKYHAALNKLEKKN